MRYMLIGMTDFKDGLKDLMADVQDRGKISVIEMFINQSVSVPEDAIYQDVLVDDELVGLGEADQFILLNLQPLTTLHQADNRGQFFNSVFLGKTINFPIHYQFCPEKDLR